MEWPGLSDIGADSQRHGRTLRRGDAATRGTTTDGSQAGNTALGRQGRQCAHHQRRPWARFGVHRGLGRTDGVAARAGRGRGRGLVRVGGRGESAGSVCRGVPKRSTSCSPSPRSGRWASCKPTSPAFSAMPPIPAQVLLTHEDFSGSRPVPERAQHPSTASSLWALFR